MTDPDQNLISAAGELLAAVAKLRDQELRELHDNAWRLANGLSEEPARQRVADVMHRAGVVLAEEQDRRAALAEHARREIDDAGEAGELIDENWQYPDPDAPDDK